MACRRHFKYVVMDVACLIHPITQTRVHVSESARRQHVNRLPNKFDKLLGADRDPLASVGVADTSSGEAETSLTGSRSEMPVESSCRPTNLDF